MSTFYQNQRVKEGGGVSASLSLLTRRLSGATRLWFYDVGCASFMGAALLGLLMLIPIFLFEKFVVVPLIISMIQVSVSVAVAWQLNRLSATEWSCLVPEYRHNIYFQSVLIWGVSLLLGSGLCLYIDTQGALSQLAIATTLGLGFIYLCLIKPSTYYLSIVLYLSLVTIETVTSVIPPVLLLLLPVISLVLAWMIWQKVLVSGWHPDARTIYHNALEMGGVWLPSQNSYRYIAKLESSLHPLNFFMGPLLSMLIIAMPLFTIAVALIAYLFGLDVPVLFLLVQFSGVACVMVHWSRIQRWQAVEALYMLPGFNGKQGMIDAFNRAQCKLLLLLTLIMVVTAAAVSLVNPAITTAIWLHFVLSSIFGCGFILGAGSACKTTLQLSATMLIIIAHSAWVSSSLRLLTEESHVWPWLAGDLIFVVISMLTLWFGSKRLWKGDLV
ncbi:hypothetical protein [Shewanella sp. UCD-KL12]|uniref:hypothetical protein n=1 Tax=Shewanella sp. UCD-KL12 TaxID=1917163 RepID=UPI000970481B|nr:hypothetical protein [Shewanella sp. UCD-KL12]